MNSRSVIIAENSWLIRKGLAGGIEEMDVKAGIYECQDLEELRDKLSVFYIHYVFINPDILNDNYSALLELKAEYSSLIFIGLVTGDNIKYDRFFDHIIQLNAGKSEITKKLDTIFRQEGQTAATANTGLSEREKSILTLVARGRTNQEIADELFISTHTVISHRKNITRKLGIKTVAGLAVYAVINNLADANDLK